MPFEKPTAVAGERGGGRTLLLAATLLTAALLFLRVGSPEASPPCELGSLTAALENEAVRGFLQLDAVE